MIKIVPGSFVHRAYEQEEVTEQFACSYGLNPQFREKVGAGKLKITGVDVLIIIKISDQFFIIG